MNLYFGMYLICLQILMQSLSEISNEDMHEKWTVLGQKIATLEIVLYCIKLDSIDSKEKEKITNKKVRNNFQTEINLKSDLALFTTTDRSPPPSHHLLLVIVVNVVVVKEEDFTTSRCKRYALDRLSRRWVREFLHLGNSP